MAPARFSHLAGPAAIGDTPLNQVVASAVPADHPRIVLGFTTALADEVAKMAEWIPPDDLAIQWDLAIENRRVEAALLEGGADAAVLDAKRVTEPLRLINARLPEGVALGYHSCFGTLRGWPSRRPHNLRGSVILLNEAVTSCPPGSELPARIARRLC
jgi:hypothetical protein